MHDIDVLMALTEAIKHNPATKILKQNPTENKAFVIIKYIFAKISALNHSDLDATQYHLVSDHSKYMVGAALYQIINDDPVLTGFYLRKLSENQRKYPTFDTEILVAYQVVSFTLQTTN